MESTGAENAGDGGPLAARPTLLTQWKTVGSKQKSGRSRIIPSHRITKKTDGSRPNATWLGGRVHGKLTATRDEFDAHALQAVRAKLLRTLTAEENNMATPAGVAMRSPAASV